MRSDFDFVHVEKSKGREAKAEGEKPRLDKENLEYIPALLWLREHLGGPWPPTPFSKALKKNDTSTLLLYRTITRIQKVDNQLSFIHWCRLTETVWNLWIIWGYKWHCCCLETGRPVQLPCNGNQHRQPLDDQLVTTTSFNHSLNVKKKITAIYWELTICPSCEKEGAITTNWMENVISSMQIINKQLSASCGAKQHACCMLFGCSWSWDDASNVICGNFYSFFLWNLKLKLKSALSAPDMMA